MPSKIKMKRRLSLTKEDILLLLDCLIFAEPPHNFKVGRQYKGKPTLKTSEHLAELYQTIGQAMGEEKIILEFEFIPRTLKPEEPKNKDNKVHGEGKIMTNSLTNERHSMEWVDEVLNDFYDKAFHETEETGKLDISLEEARTLILQKLEEVERGARLDEVEHTPTELAVFNYDFDKKKGITRDDRIAELSNKGDKENE